MAKAFDWSQYPAEGEGAQAPKAAGGKFDWNQFPAETDEAPAASGPGAGQAALEHFGNAASFGYLPQLQAVTLPNASSDVDAKLRAQGFKIDQPADTYLSRRDANLRRIAKEGEDSPVASAVGTGGGILASGIALGGLGGAGKAATLAKDASFAQKALAVGGRVFQAAKTGAIMGAAANPGDTEGELNPIQATERLNNAKYGAASGAVIQGAIEAAPTVSRAIRWAGRKLGSIVSGVSDDTIAQYAKRTDQINQMIKEAGGNMTEAADQVRLEAQDALRSKRATLSSQIGKALEAAPEDPVANVGPLIDQLKAAKARLNPNLKAEAVQQIEDVIEKLRVEAKTAGAGGKVSVQQLNEITDFLQERGKSAYMQGGQIFQGAKEAARASKGAAAVSRKMLNALSPEIAEANNQLSLLHTLEDRLNPNLIAPGKPEAALLAAGAGANPRNVKMLQQIGDASGYPLLEKAKDLSAASTFAKPSFLPSDYTGKAVARQLIAGGIGHAVAGPLGYLAAAAASPAAVKLAVNTANAMKGVPPAVAGFIQKNPRLLQTVAQSIVNPQDDRLRETESPDNRLMQESPAGVNRSPAKGEAAWVQSGIEKLGITDPAQVSRILKTPEGRRLLIRASDLTPGTPAMENLRKQIQKGIGK